MRTDAGAGGGRFRVRVLGVGAVSRGSAAFDVRSGGRPSVVVLWAMAAAPACWCFGVYRTLPRLCVTAVATPRPCLTRLARRRCGSNSVA